MRTNTHIEIVDKNEVGSFKWPNENLHDQEMLEDIMIKIKVAMILGNTERIKCKIFFKDTVGIKMIETTIWTICDKNIIIKSGLWIPIRRVIDIEI